jgi:hypothetical protein
MTTTKEELEKAAKLYASIFSSKQGEHYAIQGFLAGAMHGIRIGFEAGREIYSADEGTNSYRYNIEDFLKEIE